MRHLFPSALAALLVLSAAAQAQTNPGAAPRPAQGYCPCVVGGPCVCGPACDCPACRACGRTAYRPVPDPLTRYAEPARVVGRLGEWEIDTRTVVVVDGREVGGMADVPPGARLTAAVVGGGRVVRLVFAGK